MVKAKPCTKEEIEIIKTYYVRVPSKKMQEYLPDRSLEWIRRKARELGVTFLRLKGVQYASKLRELGWTKEDAIYIAGLVDGEGTITLKKSKFRYSICYTPCLSIANNSKIIMDDLKQLGFGIWRKSVPLKKEWNRGYVAEVRGISVKPFLERIYPYLRIKKEHCLILLEFCEAWLNSSVGTQLKNVIDYYNKLKVLNAHANSEKAMETER